MNADEIREDFDRIAQFPTGPGRYDARLLAQLPARCRRALDVGCGTGDFARRLAERAGKVVAVDLSPRMIEVARAAGGDNIEYLVGQWPLALGEFDCVISIATLHHLPFEETLRSLASALLPGGLLLVHDLFRDDGLGDRLLSAIAFASTLHERARSGDAARRAAWAAHAKHDRFMTLGEVRSRARATLPGARVVRHLYWRYTLSWSR